MQYSELSREDFKSLFLTNLFNTYPQYAPKSQSEKISNIENKLNQIINGLETVINQTYNVSSNRNLLADIDDRTINIKRTLDELSSKFDNIQIPSETISAFKFSSLNGSSGSFKDDEKVFITGYDDEYKVISSQFFLNDKKEYMIMYLLENDDKKFLVPDIYVSKQKETTEEKQEA